MSISIQLQQGLPLPLLPVQWKLLKASELCLLVTDGTHDSPKPVVEGFPLITSKHLHKGTISFQNSYYVSYADYQQANKRSKVDQYDVLFSMIGTIGTAAFVSEHPQFAIKNVGLFKTNQDRNLGLWLFYFFQTDFIQKYLRLHISGTSQKYVPLWLLQELPILFPPPAERNAIIQILHILQETLQVRQKELELELERKTALLHHLFTQGIHNEATKQSEVGEIPESWKVVKLEQIMVSDPQNGLYKPESYYGTGTPIIRIDAFDNGDVIEAQRLKRLKLSSDELTRYAVFRDDIIINRVNGSLDLLAKCALIGQISESIVFESNMMRFSVESTKCISSFVVHFLCTEQARDQIKRKARFIHQASVNQQDIKSLLIPLPDKEEQREITDILKAHNSCIKILEKEIMLYGELFRALLEELTTGRISTLPLVEQLEKGTLTHGQRTPDGTGTTH